MVSPTGERSPMKTITNVARVVMALSVALALTGPLLAQAVQDRVTPAPGIAPPQVPTTPAPWAGKAFGSGIGAGLVLIGAALGFGRIGAAALESMARQPEVAG